MRLVLALGGNALLRRGERADFDVQRRHVREAVQSLSGLARDHELLITHGNGPQVGLLALQAEAFRGGPTFPLDVLGAESEGMIGYLLAQELENVLPDREVATLLTQVEVDARDPAFARPTKPIGPVYEPAEGERLAKARGWVLAADGGGVRRVVPSPLPRRVLELRTIRRLLDAGVIVICSGGGGIPVVVNGAGLVHGVEAVIDKDRSAALLATCVEADGLLLLTDAPGIYAGFGTPEQRLLREITYEDLRGMAFDEGSMGPKVEAACAFVERGHGFAAVGALAEAAAVAAGHAGTRITRVATLHAAG